MLQLVGLIVLFVISAPSRAATVLVLGDSLSAGYGLTETQGWVALLQAQVKTQARGTDVSKQLTLINASISGETSAGGLARIDALLQRHQPRVVIVQLGANDGLRGLAVKQVRSNLDAIISRAVKSGARVLLLGIELPINYGTRYRDAFRKMYAELARQHSTGFVPFFLSDIAADRKNFQADGIHPTAAAQPKLLAQVRPALDALAKL